MVWVFSLFSVAAAQDYNPIDFKLDFCGDSREFLVWVNDNSDLCVIIENTRTESAKFSLNVVQWGAPKWKSKLWTCAAEDKFLPWVTSDLDIVSLWALEKKEVNIKLNMWPGMAGEQYWCVTAIDQTQISDAGWVATVIRKAKSFKIFVDSDVDVGLEVVNPKGYEWKTSIFGKAKLFWSAAGSWYNFALWFENTWDLVQSVDVTAKIGDTFKKITDLGTQQITVWAKEIGNVEFSAPDMPWYKLWYTVKFDVTHRAISDVKSEFITEDMLADKSLSESETFFLFPRWLVLVALALLLFIWFLFWLTKKRKKNNAHQAELEAQLAEFKAMKEQQQQQQEWQQEAQEQNEQ